MASQRKGFLSIAWASLFLALLAGAGYSWSLDVPAGVRVVSAAEAEQVQGGATCQIAAYLQICSTNCGWALLPKAGERDPDDPGMYETKVVNCNNNPDPTCQVTIVDKGKPCGPLFPSR